MKLAIRAVLIAALALAAFVIIASPAHAGSDSPTPYTVSAEGITLPTGVTFADNGHVNVRTNQGDRGIHFESLNNQPSGQWIGKPFLPWSAFGFDAATLCVSWVQIAEYNEHFGEGGQAPVGNGCAPAPSPTPSTTASPTPTPSIEPSPTATPVPTDSPSETKPPTTSNDDHPQPEAAPPVPLTELPATGDGDWWKIAAVGLFLVAIGTVAIRVQR